MDSYLLAGAGTPPAAGCGAILPCSDCGSGIHLKFCPAEKPFFTTKALSTRRGTGLGLSMVYELAKKMQAGLAVESVLEGSTFTLTWPVCDVVSSRPQCYEQRHSSPIVEDDDFQYEIYEEALAKYQLVRAAMAARIQHRRVSSSSTTSARLTVFEYLFRSSRTCCRSFRYYRSPGRSKRSSEGVAVAAPSALLPAEAGGCPRTPPHHRAPLLKNVARRKPCANLTLERAHRVDAQELFSRSQPHRLTARTGFWNCFLQIRQRPNISAFARRTVIRDLQEMIRRGSRPRLIRSGEIDG